MSLPIWISLFPVHPRTLQRVSEAGLRDVLEDTSGSRTLPALGYLDFLKLQAAARLVITDSGGIQEETAVLRVPCVTIRKNTERPMTISHGTNVLGGTEPEGIVSACLRAIRGEWRIPETIPELWDGRTAERILPLSASTAFSAPPRQVSSRWRSGNRVEVLYGNGISIPNISLAISARNTNSANVVESLAN